VLEVGLVKGLDNYLELVVAVVVAGILVVVVAVPPCLMAATAVKTLYLWFRVIL
jgi:hypothetical protein